MPTWRHLLVETTCFGCSRNDYSPLIITGIPLDNTASYRPGTRLAPSSIRDAGCNIELNSIYTGKDMDEIGFNDLGDIAVVIGDNDLSVNRIKRVVNGVYNEYPNRLPIFIGGEHTITYGVLSGLPTRDIGYIVFDAHLDLRSEYMGYSLSHASTQYLIYNKLGIKPIIVGARAWCNEEYYYALREDLPIYTPKTLYNHKKNFYKEIIDKLSSYSYIYISIDMDVLDPSYAPGVSNPEPLGLTPLTLLDILADIIREIGERRIIGFDIVEVNPVFDYGSITSILAAKLIVEISSLILESK